MSISDSTTMTLVASVKLDVDPDDRAALFATLTTMNAAAQLAADHAFHKRVWGKSRLQAATYHSIREQFGLGAQAAIHAIRKAANSYADTSRRSRPQTICPVGAVAFDDRNLAWNLDADEVRIWTVNGRRRIPILMGDRQRKLLADRKGESDLEYRDGEWYLTACCVVEQPDRYEPVGWMGVDLGITNIAAYDRTQVAGKELNARRRRYDRVRTRLQSKNTKSSKRLLRKRRRREQRMAADVNHQISKQVVREAKRTGRGIALEDLGGIRDRVTVRRPQRRQLHSWSFYQLRAFIEYKAALQGVPVVAVNPRNTSRTCPHCTYTSKANRPARDRFVCQACGFVDHADLVGALNISRRGAVMRPYAGDLGAVPAHGLRNHEPAPSATCKPPAKAGRS